MSQKDKILTLRMQRDCAVLELVEWCVIILVDLDELLLKTFQLVLILRILTQKQLEFGLEFRQIS